ncbi:hypothetical protein CPAR01_11419 [Colletotrichum paranaense]|uniref:Uncharacterized protein n=1 Tax=Colletotrichum paranaense TaxID=1914294 RepID=A0ABQ9SBL3_9PEZI|nr:uncharacterized protein CPAR01_11419 [Colletotrichum paranaense]KAK1531770.1 hypothetical protein CPAR01_11419 [Colletotrichum paranaense]
MLGCREGLWGEAAGSLVRVLRKFSKTQCLIYVSKVGSLAENVSANERIATGDESTLGDKAIAWDDPLRDLKSIASSDLVLRGRHVSVPSPLCETKEWLRHWQETCAWVDCETWHMAQAAKDVEVKFGYLHIVSDNLAEEDGENLSNEDCDEIQTSPPAKHMTAIALRRFTGRVLDAMLPCVLIGFRPKLSAARGSGKRTGHARRGTRTEGSGNQGLCRHYRSVQENCLDAEPPLWVQVDLSTLLTSQPCIKPLDMEDRPQRLQVRRAQASDLLALASLRAEAQRPLVPAPPRPLVAVAPYPGFHFLGNYFHRNIFRFDAHGNPYVPVAPIAIPVVGGVPVVLPVGGGGGGGGGAGADSTTTTTSSSPSSSSSPPTPTSSIPASPSSSSVDPITSAAELSSGSSIVEVVTVTSPETTIEVIETATSAAPAATSAAPSPVPCYNYDWKSYGWCCPGPDSPCQNDLGTCYFDGTGATNVLPNTAACPPGEGARS